MPNCLVIDVCTNHQEVERTFKMHTTWNAWNRGYTDVCVQYCRACISTSEDSKWQTHEAKYMKILVDRTRRWQTSSSATSLSAHKVVLYHTSTSVRNCSTWLVAYQVVQLRTLLLQMYTTTTDVLTVYRARLLQRFMCPQTWQTCLPASSYNNFWPSL